jgi:serine/threonine protein kinase
MDFCPGGELFFHLHNLGRLTEPQAQFYFAEILLAIEHLHSLGVVYRDLKPENVLLDLDGHVRLTDFGLSKEHMRKDSVAFSFCGSPEYMSPEMLKEAGHSFAVDYYSIGALLYEMLTGLPPFYNRNRERMYHAILNNPLLMPKYISRNGRSLLGGLLEKDPRKRLGAEKGFTEIKAHPWLERVDWERVLKRKKSPPFIPNLRLSNFDPEYTSEPIDFRDQGPSIPSDPFSGFEYDASTETDEHSPVYLFPASRSKSASEMSTISTESRISRSQMNMPVIHEEEDEHHISKDMEISLIRAEASPVKRQTSLPADPRFKDAKKAVFLAKPQLPVVPDESLTARFWEDSQEEESIVREIPDLTDI